MSMRALRRWVRVVAVAVLSTPTAAGDPDSVWSDAFGLGELDSGVSALLVFDDGGGVDARHGVGHGEHGGEATEHGSLAGADYGLGGFVAGPAEVIEFIKCTSRSMIFSAACPPSNTAAALKALEILESEPEHVDRVRQNTDYMRVGFRELEQRRASVLDEIRDIVDARRRAQVQAAA